MKGKLLITAVVFVGLLAALTAFIAGTYNKPQTQPDGSYAVEVNEIRQLISNGDTALAQLRAGELAQELSQKTQKDDKSSQMVWAVFFAASAVIATVFIYVWFAILRPFNKLQDFAERVAGGDFSLPLEYERTNYFGRFTWAFDCMRREISVARECEREAIENNKTVIASLSHDIKTPVASIRAYAEGLEAGMDTTPQKRARYLEVIMRKCDEVAALTNDMLLHSVSDLNRLKMNPTRLELCSFIKEAVPEISARDNIKVSLPSTPVEINADRSRLTQALENVVSNAMKYAKTDVEISVLKAQSEAEIIIRDFGKGVPDEEMPFIFDKFYRGRDAENENGSGLGLYIVKYIVRQSGGEVYAENLPDGFMIKIILPILNS